MYISHLDLLRTFQRVFLRQGIVLRHSQGFHPHPILSFALPLSVGQESVCELLDLETVEDLDCAALPGRLAPSLPEGIRALECRAPARPIRDLAELLCRVELVYDGGVPAGGAEEVGKLLTGETLVVQKRTKRKAMADIDIRPMLHSLDIQESACLLTLEAEVSAQNPGMNPALLAAAVEVHRPELSPDFVRVRRLAVLDAEGKVFR